MCTVDRGDVDRGEEFDKSINLPLVGPTLHITALNILS